MSDRKSQGSSVLNELTIPVTESEHSEEGIILQELFGDIDWTQVNLGELEQQWRTELANIEQDNVKALMDSANRSQQVLPALLKAIEEVGAVEGLLVDYCQRLQLMGVEIQQIEELNRGLNIQTGNQQVLLCELDQILGMVNLPDDIVVSVERMPLGVPANAQKIADAARAIHKLLSTKFEDGLGNIMAVSERMEFYSNTLRRFVDKLASFFISAFAGYRDKFLTQKGSRKVIKLTGLDELEPFLVAYAPLISGLREMDGRKHTEIAAAYQSDMSAMYRKEATDLVETMKSNRLIKKNADEKPYLFVSLGASTTDKISMAAVGERIISIGQQKVTIPTDRDLVTIQPFDVDNFPELESNEHLSADQLFHYLILSIALVMATQQDICATIFYGIQDEEIADERLLRLVDSMLMASFAPTGEILSQLVEYITKNDNSTAIEMLVVLDVRIPQLISELPVFAKTLQNIKRRLLTVAENFVADQVAIIDASKFTARKRAGVFPFVSLFPTFIKKMESVVGVAPGGAAREIMNKGYDRITAAIFRSLDALARGAERMDEKERINASVMSIQNGHYLVSQLNAIRTAGVEKTFESASARYEEHLALYSSLSLHRVFTRLFDFFMGMAKLLENTPPEEVAFNALYNKASAKRVLQAYPVKEVRKSLEMVFARVQKHFSDDKQLQHVVWRAVQDEFVKDSTEFADYIARVYPGTDFQLGYSVADAMACFSDIARHSH